MNPYYHYKYANGLQFVTTSNPEMLIQFWHRVGEKAKLIGVWRFKKLTNKNK